MYVHRIFSGSKKQFLKLLLRESYRLGGQVKLRTLANLSTWKQAEIEQLESALKLRRTCPPGSSECVSAEATIYTLVATKLFATKPSAPYQILSRLRRPHGSDPVTGLRSTRAGRKAKQSIQGSQQSIQNNWRPVSAERQIELYEPVSMQK